jgi:homoserine O-succinyltransferase
MKSERKIKVAILDLYAGEPNQGMRCIRQILTDWAGSNGYDVSFKEYDVRLQHKTPDTSYDIYISSGGPGSPLESKGSDWEKVYFDWLRSVEDWNNSSENFPKKHVFFICHSFQLICRHYNVGNVCKRKSTAFGVFPIHMTDDGRTEPVFDNMPNPFYAVDSRDYQVIEPNFIQLIKSGAQILAIEKERPHVPYERAIMAIRFNEYFIGTQFHPEADAEGMSMYLQREDKKKTVIENHGEEKWSSMLEDLSDPDKIMWTYNHILPNFLNQAVKQQVLQE